MKNKKIIALGIILAIALSSFFMIGVPNSMAEEPIKKYIAFTFDDGPSEITPLLLDLFENEGAKVTFFISGGWVHLANSTVTQRQLALGCEIGNHSMLHQYMNTYTAEQVREEIELSQAAIKAKYGIEPKLFRSPMLTFGGAMAKNIPMPVIHARIDPQDWNGSTTSQNIIDTVSNNAQDGDIVLFHDYSGQTKTLNAVTSLIPTLKARGFEFVTVSELFEIKGINPFKGVVYNNITTSSPSLPTTTTNTVPDTITTTTTTVSDTTTTTIPEYKKGDVNNDGTVDVEDLLLVKKHVLKINEFAEESPEFKAADVNNDGSVDVEDLLKIKKHVLKIEDLE